MKNRRIKVAAFYTNLHPNLKVAPALRLAGEWLRNAGFVPGDVVAVEVTRGRLVITKNTAQP
jgi:hypothetical protein